MRRPVRVGLVGDYNDQVTAHRAIPRALRIAGNAAGREIEETWLPTSVLGADAAIDLSAFSGLWCVPGSPYQSFEGALRAIRFAREHAVPFLGTCGGFQHAVIEYARHVLGHEEAEHLEISPSATVPLFARLSCSMIEVDARVEFSPNSRIAEIYRASSAVERYHCSFGFNPAYASWFAAGAMRVSGVDEAGAPRVVELADHPFFVGTAYQPERSALSDRSHPLIAAFVEALTE